MPHIRAVNKHALSLSFGQKAGMKDFLRTNKSGFVVGRLKKQAGLKQLKITKCFQLLELLVFKKQGLLSCNVCQEFLLCQNWGDKETPAVTECCYLLDTLPAPVQ